MTLEPLLWLHCSISGRCGTQSLSAGGAWGAPRFNPARDGQLFQIIQISQLYILISQLYILRADGARLVNFKSCAGKLIIPGTLCVKMARGDYRAVKPGVE